MGGMEYLTHHCIVPYRKEDKEEEKVFNPKEKNNDSAKCNGIFLHEFALVIGYPSFVNKNIFFLLKNI